MVVPRLFAETHNIDLARAQNAVDVLDVVAVDLYNTAVIAVEDVAVDIAAVTRENASFFAKFYAVVAHENAAVDVADDSTAVAR